jgi:hypothetical protein
MIMASIGRYLAPTGHDHETRLEAGRCRSGFGGAEDAGVCHGAREPCGAARWGAPHDHGQEVAIFVPFWPRSWSLSLSGQDHGVGMGPGATLIPHRPRPSQIGTSTGEIRDPGEARHSFTFSGIRCLIVLVSESVTGVTDGTSRGRTTSRRRDGLREGARSPRKGAAGPGVLAAKGGGGTGHARRERGPRDRVCSPRKGPRDGVLSDS